MTITVVKFCCTRCGMEHAAYAPGFFVCGCSPTVRTYLRGV